MLADIGYFILALIIVVGLIYLIVFYPNTLALVILSIVILILSYVLASLLKAGHQYLRRNRLWVWMYTELLTTEYLSKLLQK